MLIRVLIAVVMLAILFCLGSGLYYLVKDRGETEHTVKALTWRIGLSLVLFILLFVAFSLGWIKPHGI